ncbi:MAG TPA: hypothetical protein VMG10_36440 [Gemmataceae bacterium]|nr:hypothetical protein [Gemmataceae bacterium]
MRKVVFCLTAALVLACSSCGNNKKIYPVSGKMTYNGSPASGAVVFFHRQGGDTMKEPTIMGIVQEDGSFELVCGPLGKGAPPGDYDVLVEWKRITGRGKRRPQAGPDILQGRYADPKRPLLHATVEARATNLPPFELPIAGAVLTGPNVRGRR